MSRRIALGLALIGIVVAIVLLEQQRAAPAGSNPNGFAPSSPDVTMSAAEKAMLYPRPKELADIAGYLNTEGITINELQGKKVILVDFWTYSCINCQRTLPYLNAWYERYRDQGLEIIGVHTPEFEFEGQPANLQAAIAKYNIKYPVVMDNNYATWRAYNNRYWPRKYLIDIDGFIVYDHIGEGGYAETEQKIRELLAERKQALGEPTGLGSDMATPRNVAAVNFKGIATPETYFGAARNTSLGNGQSEKLGSQQLRLPTTLEPNKLYLAGDWAFTDEYAEPKSGGKIVLKYNAKDVYFVAAADPPIRIHVTRDGQELGAAAGADIKVINERSTTLIEDDRLYKLVSDPLGYGEHTIEITIEDPGLHAFTFTFG